MVMLTLPTSRSGKTALEVATRAVKKAGALITARFHTEKKVTSKGRGNVVTDVDLLVEREVIEFLQDEYPDHGILCEETGGKESFSEYTWILDPLDGTRNFASGIPFFSVALALAKGEDVLLGMVFDPIRSELFRAEKGKGASLNDMPISVSKKESLQASVVGFDMGYDDDMARTALRLITSLWPGMQSIRVMGSAALGVAYAACGRVDIYFHHSLYPWDIAGGLLLVREAGGVATEKDGGPAIIKSRAVIASNPIIHADFMRLTESDPWRKL